MLAARRTLALPALRRLHTSSSSLEGSRFRFGDQEESFSRKRGEAKRQGRLVTQILNASLLSKNPTKPSHGSDRYAGWKPTPGRSQRNSGRPRLASEAQRRAEKVADMQPVSDHPLTKEEVQQFINPQGKIKAGDFVEIRRAGSITVGIVLPAPKDRENAKAENAIFVLVSSGTVALYRDTDVMMQIPHVVESSLTSRAAPLSENFVAHSMVKEVDPSSALTGTQEPIDEQRFEARASICAKLRTLQRQREKEIQRLLPGFQSLFGLETNTGTITTYQAVRRMNEVAYPVGDITASTMLAGHTLLMNKPEKFIADGLSHRTSSLFTLRGRKDRKTLELVKGWIQSSDQSTIKAFCEKAKAIREWAASHPYQPSGSPQPIKGPDVKWTAEDQEIISYLQASLGSRREIQSDTHGSVAMEILKRSGAHIQSRPHPEGKDNMTLPEATSILLTTQTERDISILKDLGSDISAGGDLQHTLVEKFLKEIGALTPWHNPLRLDMSFRTLTMDSAPEDESNTATKWQHEHDQAVEGIRHDFGQLPVYVIDDVGAFELDDGISIERISERQVWVHVHVADPTSSIEPASHLARRANRRFSTLYLPEARWALLPDAFVKSGVGITNSTNGQRVFTFSAKVDARNGEVDDYQVRPAWIRNVKVISYEHVNSMLKKGVAEKELVHLKNVAEALCAKRVQGTALTAWRKTPSVRVSPLPLPDHPLLADTPTFYTGSPDISFSAESLQSNIQVHASQFLVSEYMLLAGRIASLFGAEHNIPLPYRTQPFPTTGLDQLQAMKAPRTGLVQFEKLLAADLTIPSGGYSHTPLPHFSLGMDGYVRATSPLRRYPDMVAHWQIKAALTGRAVPFDADKLSSQLGQFERQDLLTRQLMRSAEKYWVHKRVGEALDRQRAGKETEEDQSILGPHVATVHLTDVRINPSTLAARLRVQVEGLGVPADMVWRNGNPTPEKGQEFKVRISQVIQAGIRSGIVVEPI